MSERSDSHAEEARRWLAQASEDLGAATRSAGDAESPPRIACFLAHLAAEKAMKAWLIHLAIPFRRVHDLGELLARLPSDAASALNVDDLIILNPWAILGRYPDDISEATPSDADACVEAAERVVSGVRTAISGASSDNEVRE